MTLIEIDVEVTTLYTAVMQDIFKAKEGDRALEIAHKERALGDLEQKLFGSIFPGKLIFENGNYRTTELNKAVESIGLFQRDLRNKKAERLMILSKRSEIWSVAGSNR